MSNDRIHESELFPNVEHLDTMFQMVSKSLKFKLVALLIATAALVL